MQLIIRSIVETFMYKKINLIPDHQNCTENSVNSKDCGSFVRVKQRRKVLSVNVNLLVTWNKHLYSPEQVRYSFMFIP